MFQTRGAAGSEGPGRQRALPGDCPQPCSQAFPGPAPPLPAATAHPGASSSVRPRLRFPGENAALGLALCPLVCVLCPAPLWPCSDLQPPCSPSLVRRTGRGPVRDHLPPAGSLVQEPGTM